MWIFASLNYIYCDVIGLMDADNLKQYLTGTINNIDMTQGFLLGSTILVEIPMAMVLLSRILAYRANRLLNIAAGSVMTLVQVATLFVGTSTMYYIFSSAVEIATTIAIVTVAWRWSNTEEALATSDSQHATT